MDTNKQNEKTGTDRRNFISTTLIAAAGLTMLTGARRGDARTSPRQNKPGRRRLGKLEVSAVGMGVQNMHRKYETTTPYRPEMIDILRSAYDRGTTFFDCAEAYGTARMLRDPPSAAYQERETQRPPPLAQAHFLHRRQQLLGATGQWRLE